MQTVTLKGKDFTVVHNALCDLRLLANKDEKIQSLVEKFEEGLRDCYDQDSNEFDKKFNHYRDVQFKNGFESVWSIYELSDLYLPHGYGEDLTVVYDGVEVEVEGNNWVALWKAADKAIWKSGDSHHIFIEQFRKEGKKLHLVTGS